MPAKVSILTLLLALCVGGIQAQPEGPGQKKSQKKKPVTENTGDQTIKIGTSRTEGVGNQTIKAGVSRTEGTGDQTSKVGISKHKPFTVTKTVNQSSPQMSPPGWKNGNANNTDGTGMPGIDALVAVSNEKANIANQNAMNGSASQRQLVKKEAQLNSQKVKTTAITPPAGAIQANPNQPTRKKKSAARHKP